MTEGSSLLPSRDSTPGPIDTQHLRRWTPPPSSQAPELSSVRVSRYAARSSRSDLSVLRVDTSARQTSVAPEHRPATPTSATPATPGHKSEHGTTPEPYDDLETQERIPRPPNAFMLFRSHCIKTIREKAAKEKTGEKRQQVFSRVAGEAWHMLEADEREEWTRRATDALHAHQRKYPGYKFTPAPRGSSKKGKGAGGEGAGDTVEDIRAKYLNMPGAAVKAASNRKRNSRKNHTVGSASPAPNIASPSTSHVRAASTTPNHYPAYTYPSAPQPSYAQQRTLLDSPYGSPHIQTPESNPYPKYGRDQPSYGRELFSGTPHMDPSIPPYFPNPSFGHFVEQPQPMPQHLRPTIEHPLPLLPGALITQRRPSTSLGFISHRTSGPTGSPVLPPSERPASASASGSQRPGLIMSDPVLYAMPPHMRQATGPLVEPIAAYTLDASDVTFPSEAGFSHTDYFPYSASTYNEFSQVLNYAEVDYEGMANNYNPASADYRPPSA
ncbi:hypothetical protein CYLTODRAFT_448694 [Cylindrobasidium torrendii FP15055 ss-10]|uniref:HMG box domain-containing protein n=1 Tax=Cylindrobasidium torrendii FP15055 ss-10 TaxID=1314674 RepID=A0A0D7BU84_9AGAR|nr:hypothetical protein CYLTODRAFT_448694 [Cylindrobasidium torrendii FP15055 ss-10]